MIKKSLNIFCVIFSILIIGGCGSCIPYLDIEPCKTPKKETIGINDEFSITPLKSNYNVGEKIRVKFIVKSKAYLQNDNSVLFDLYKNTGYKNAKNLSGESIPEGLELLLGNSNNELKFLEGSFKNHFYIYNYINEEDSYILEMEITLNDKKTYVIDNFSLELRIGNDLGEDLSEDCDFYIHKFNSNLSAPISFEVN